MARRRTRQKHFEPLALVLVVVLVLAVAWLGYRWAAPTGGLEKISRLVGNFRPEASIERNDLSTMRTAEINIKGRKFRLWLAETPQQHRLGLMWVRPDQMADDQGMLFVFRTDQTGPFWMKNTLVPLEIAFIRSDGTVLAVDRMEPRSLVHHKPPEPYRYALEVKAGSLSAVSLQRGDVVLFPPMVLNR